MKRRPISPFSLSFLDIMFCGFGAVVLLVLILNSDTVRARNETFADLRAEVVSLEQNVIVDTEAMVTARNSLTATDEDLVVTQGEAERVIETLRELEIEIAEMEKETLASKEHIARLSSDLKSLDTEKKRLGAEAAADRDQGERVHRVEGEGDRQYLTGLKVGGRRILILVDASASMLDETLVNVIRRRNMSERERRGAPKWRRAVATAEWLLGNLPAASKFQIYAFNTDATPLVEGSAGQWLDAGSRDNVTGAVAGLARLIPADGTSLYKAFAVAGDLAPQPDNILLVTDGLPTQGREKPRGTTVTADRRLEHFGRAQNALPARIPINTILLPMEGDAYAAAAFWKLAVDTRGSFITPARDWP